MVRHAGTIAPKRAREARPAPLRGCGATVDTPSRATGLSSTKEEGHLQLSATWPDFVKLSLWPTDGWHGVDAGVERGGALEKAYQLLCECSYKLRCEVLSHGEQLGAVTFFDDDEASVTQGERIWCCPGCRSRLGLLSLRPRGRTQTKYPIW